MCGNPNAAAVSVARFFTSRSGLLLYEHSYETSLERLFSTQATDSTKAWILLS